MQAPENRKTFRPSLSMLGWALNEEENIGRYIERAEAFLHTLTDDFELIIVDDGSTDQTWAIGTSYQATRPWLRLVRNDGNKGPGYCIKRTVALSQKDFLFWQTVDWSYDISRLGEFMPQLADGVILQGVRSNAAVGRGLFKHRSDNAWKALVSIVNYGLIRVLFRLPLADYQNVTIYPRKLIQSAMLETESAFTNPECLLKTWWKGAHFREFPSPFIKRERGVAKGTRLWAIWSAVTDIIHWWFRWIVLGRRQDRGSGKVVPWLGESTEKTQSMPAIAATARKAA
jgi:glycosyltransferase involved in cell wall biosynthesis